MGMELKVWVDGIQRVVCGVSEQTTCQEVVIALARAIGEPSPSAGGTPHLQVLPGKRSPWVGGGRALWWWGCLWGSSFSTPLLASAFPT